MKAKGICHATFVTISCRCNFDGYSNSVLRDELLSFPFSRLPGTEIEDLQLTLDKKSEEQL